MSILCNKWTANYGDALTFRHHLRANPPAIYNSARLHERPIPNLDSDDGENAIEDPQTVCNAENIEFAVEFGIGLPTQAVNNENPRTNRDIESDENGELAVELESPNQAVGQNLGTEQQEVIANIEEVSIPNNDLTADSVEIKEEEIDPIAITEEDAAELSRILGGEQDSISSHGNDNTYASNANGEADVNTDDDIIWENPKACVPMPAKCTAEAMPKRENDIISGNLSFSERVSSNEFTSNTISN